MLLEISRRATLKRTPPMKAVLFLPQIYSGNLDEASLGEQLRAAIISAFGCCDIRLENDRVKQFSIRFQHQSRLKPKLLIEVEILTSGYMKDFYQGGLGLAIRRMLRECGMNEVIPSCEIELSVTMRTSLVL